MPEQSAAVQSTAVSTVSHAGLAPGRWTIDASHSTVGFSVRHMMVSKVRGRFERFSGEITVGDTAADSSVAVEVDMSSINTADEKRDAHLRANDFFDIDTYPTMTFRSTGVREDANGVTVVGDLTIRGVTRTVELPLELEGVGTDPWGGVRAGFSAETQINRKDFGIEWNAPLEAGGVLVGDTVKITLDIEAVKA